MNKIIIIGRLVRDPEIVTTSLEKKVANYTLAVDRKYQKDKTDFFNITAWEGKGDFAYKYFKKGMKVAVSGRMEQEHYTDNENKKRIDWKVVVEEQFFADRTEKEE